jgi:metal-responsive CopG/Arc/MetJ family transcriptional regulator
MAQITLYLDDALLTRLRASAARQQVSQSQFVSNLIRQAVDDKWPEDVLALAGALPAFPDAKGLRADLGVDAPRVL